MSGRTPRKRRICVVTGTRAEYGLLRSTMEAISKHRRLELQLVATGTHLLRSFGSTVRDMVRDGWRIDARVKMQTGDDSKLDQAEGLARGVAGIAKYLNRAKTDVVVVLGDRIEAMAGALAAITTGRFVAHIHGGDVATGDLDDSLRHAITKLAHLHLAATEAARRRIIRLGEESSRVHCVGAPGLDELRRIADQTPTSKGRSGQALIVQHPVGRSAEREGKVMRELLRAVRDAGLRRTIVFPNSDRGHSGIVAAIESHRRPEDNGAVRIARSVERGQFLRLLIEADVLVGNSSSGIIEAATAGTPALNIGPRQQGRQRSGTSVVDADESAAAIREGLRCALRKRPIRGGRSVYGDGQAGSRIARLIAAFPLTPSQRRKCITY